MEIDWIDVIDGVTVIAALGAVSLATRMIGAWLLDGLDS